MTMTPITTETPHAPVLFVGNSYAFGRDNPVMSYNAANEHDLTAVMGSPNRRAATPSNRTRGVASPASSSSSRCRRG